MSIFIPNRSIKLPKDISVPQSLSPSVFETQRRDQAFQMSKRFDGALVDVVSGAKATSVISGVRYGIVNGVVTEFGVNQPALEDAGFRGCPAFTQLASYTEDLTTAAWVKQGVFISSQQKNIIYETAITTSHAIGQTVFGVIADNSIVATRVRVTGIERHINIGLRKKDGVFLNLLKVNMTTGEIINQSTANYIIKKVDPETYDVFIFASCGVGASAPYFFLNSVNDVYSDNFMGITTKGFIVKEVTFISFGVSGIPFLPPYVPNNTDSSISVVSEAATATTGTSFDLDAVKLARLKTALRGPNAQGHLELELKTNIDSTWLPYASNHFDLGLLTNNDATIGVLFFRKAIVSGLNIFRFRASATEYAEISVNNFGSGQIFKISLDWGTHSTGQKMRLTVNGVKSSLVNFSGSFGSQDLRFFFGNTVHAGWIKKDSLKIFDRPRW